MISRACSHPRLSPYVVLLELRTWTTHVQKEESGKMLHDDMAPKVLLAFIEISLSECCSFFGFLQLAAEGCSSYFLPRVER